MHVLSELDVCILLDVERMFAHLCCFHTAVFQTKTFFGVIDFFDCLIDSVLTTETGGTVTTTTTTMTFVLDGPFIFE